MKITVLCSDVPYPPNHGGRIDTWSRLVAMKKYGVKIQLVLWWLPEEKILQEQLKWMKTIADDIIQIPRSRSIFDYLRFQYPPRMYSFFPSANIATVVKRIQAFFPDWVWLDAWHGYLLAKYLKDRFNLNFAYRSHNVEHEYFTFLAKSSHGIKKQILSFNARRLKRAEIEMRDTADVVFDISEEDALFWKEPLNVGKWRILPTLYTPKEFSPLKERTIDIGYIGNLWTPNNREGLVWFVTHVLPIIRSRNNRKLRIVFAGASPHQSIREMCQRSDIECIPNPESVDEYYRNTSVLVNPAVNASGINIKMLDMLGSGNMIVATDVVVRGIPNELRHYIKIARNAEEFAAYCIECISNPVYPNIDAVRNLLQRHFGDHHVREALKLLDNLLVKKQ